MCRGGRVVTLVRRANGGGESGWHGWSATRGKAGGDVWSGVGGKERVRGVGMEQRELEKAQCVGLAHCTERVALERRWFGAGGC